MFSYRHLKSIFSEETYPLGPACEYMNNQGLLKRSGNMQNILYESRRNIILYKYKNIKQITELEFPNSNYYCIFFDMVSERSFIIFYFGLHFHGAVLQLQ